MSKDRFTCPLVSKGDKGGGFVVTFPDMPFGITQGETAAEALDHAVAALETVIVSLMADRKDIPSPSPTKGRRTVTLPTLSAAKLGLYRATRAEAVTKADLGRRLKWNAPQIDRLLDLRHASRHDQIDQALRALGKRLVLDVRAA